MALSVLSRFRGDYLGTASAVKRLLANTAINTGATQTVDVDVSDFDLATVIVEMTGAATTDLTVTIFPIESDGATPSHAGLPVSAGTAVFDSGTGTVSQVIQVNTTGLKGIRVAVKNSNAANKVINFVDVFVGVTGTDY